MTHKISFLTFDNKVWHVVFFPTQISLKWLNLNDMLAHLAVSACVIQCDVLQGAAVVMFDMNCCVI